jgi:hypothetical protein
MGFKELGPITILTRMVSDRTADLGVIERTVHPLSSVCVSVLRTPLYVHSNLVLNENWKLLLMFVITENPAVRTRRQAPKSAPRIPS